MTQKSPAIGLILADVKEEVYLKRLNHVAQKHDIKIFIIKKDVNEHVYDLHTDTFQIHQTYLHPLMASDQIHHSIYPSGTYNYRKSQARNY